MTPAEVVGLVPRHTDELRRLREARRPQYGTGVDVWAAACVAFEILYGYALFSGQKSMVEKDILFRPLRFPARASTGVEVPEAAKKFFQAS